MITNTHFNVRFSLKKHRVELSCVMMPPITVILRWEIWKLDVTLSLSSPAFYHACNLIRRWRRMSLGENITRKRWHVQLYTNTFCFAAPNHQSSDFYVSVKTDSVVTLVVSFPSLLLRMINCNGFWNFC